MRVGRPRVSVDAEQIRQLRAQGLSWRAIAKSVGLGLGTVRRVAQSCAKNVPEPAERGYATYLHRECTDNARFLAG
jgi:DNA invertase Pin-like site-specific DNA recombinase